MTNTDKLELHDKIKAARDALKPTHQDAATTETKLTEKTEAEYLKIAKRFYGVGKDQNNLFPHDVESIIAKIRSVSKFSTLRKYARAVRHVALNELSKILQKLDKALSNNQHELVKNVVIQPSFDAYITLAKMLPADYKEGWNPKSKRKSKKVSLRGLPDDWREQMANNSVGQYHIPMLITLATGCRPAELKNGVKLILKNGAFYAVIKGAKITEHSGQEKRVLKLANNEITEKLKAYLVKDDGNPIIKVKVPNSISTHMRSVGKRIWPKRKESITAYTARHAMAADCKASPLNETYPDFVSEVLGHQADDTKSYYGTRSQSSSDRFVPLAVKSTKPVKKKNTTSFKKISKRIINNY